MTRTIWILFFFLTSLSAIAQQDFDSRTWLFIDTSIANKRNLSDLNVFVEKLTAKAILERRYFDAARCYNYKIMIADMKTEDSLYFKNSAIIDELLKNSPPELQYVLNIMQARRIANFNHRYNRFDRIYYKRKDIPVNYASYSRFELDSIATIHFERAKTVASKLTDTDIRDALWISADPLQFLFKPDLYDIIIAEQIAADRKNYSYNLSRNLIFQSWLNLSPDHLAVKLDSTYQSLRHEGNNYEDKLEIIYHYGEWLNHHQSDPATYYFLESVVHKYIYDQVKLSTKTAEGVYENYLLNNSTSSYHEVKAFAVYQLCLLWNSQASRYFPVTDGRYDFESGYTKTNSAEYDTAYRFHALKALDLFTRHQTLLDSFFYLKKILLVMEERIRRSEMTLSIPDYCLPGEPILTELKFKNADTFYYRIVRKNYDENFSDRTNEFPLKLLEKTMMTQGAIALPPTRDHNYHNIYLELPALPPGSNIIIFSSRPLADTNGNKSFLNFQVTKIAVVNNDQTVFILDRKTGKPLTGARVIAGYLRKVKKDSTVTEVFDQKDYSVNEKGFIRVDNRDYRELKIFFEGDSLPNTIGYWNKDESEDVYDKDEYDDLVDFYDENAQAYIFTDRSIYRPGQTVFFKVILTTLNRKTGERMLMNKQNLKGKLFGSVYKKWLKEEEPWLFMEDPFGKEIDSLKITPNQFGSVSGSFKIPKTAATGEWNIEPDYIDVDYHTGSFKVEEYKRPSFELSIEKPKKELKPGDEFEVKVKLRSFAGAELNNVKVNYDVTRSGYLPASNSGSSSMMDIESSDDLVDSFGFTDNQGELKLSVKDFSLLQHNLETNKEWKFTYDINVEAIDASGESFESSEQVHVSSRPIKIKIPLSNTMDRKELSELNASAEDINAGTVSKNLSIKIYRLKSNKIDFNERRFTAADLWIYDSLDLQNRFPSDKILRNDKSDSKELVLEKTINTGNKEKLELDKNIFLAGNYLLEAENKVNDTVRGTMEKRFSVFDSQENKIPEGTENFYHLVYNSVSPGDTIRYFHGNTKNETYSIINVVYFSGKTKTSISNYYNEQLYSKGLYQFSLRVPDNTVDQMVLTQVYVLNNQVYKHSEQIFVNSSTIIQPEIIIEKFRTKLTPGSKETFTVSVKTKNENIAAELMSTMYDASLDKLEKHLWQPPSFDSHRYLNLDWTGSINGVNKNFYALYNSSSRLPERIREFKPVWWVGDADHSAPEFDPYDLSFFRGYYSGEDVMGDWNFQHDLNPDARYMLSGKVAGLTISDADGLSEVVVTGYGIKRVAKEMGYATSLRIRGAASISSANNTPIVVNGLMCPHFSNDIDPSEIYSVEVLKGGEASTLYGSEAANGVIVITTKDYVEKQKQETPVVTRKNFSELAFFFPELHADKDGFYSLSFTMPESVTEWNWKMLAHTKSALFAYAERKLTTQLPLMVQPNMPRLLYQGDRIILHSRISNLDTLNSNGKISCKIVDAMTAEDITSKCLTSSQNNFVVSKKSNSNSSFELKIPTGQTNPVRITVTVRAENFADAEEHELPVLSRKIFARQNKSFYFSKSKDTTINSPSLPGDADLYGIGLSIQPQPQAAMINALPYLANYPYGCAEQNFNKLLAYITALKLIRVDSNIQHSFQQAEKFLEKENSAIEKLPDELSDETMPWLSLSGHSALRQKQLFNLLDTTRTIPIIMDLLDKIFKLKNPDGGITWFNGGKSDFYISNYLLRSFGRLAKDGELIPAKAFTSEFYQFIKDLISYCDREFLSQSEKMQMNNSLYYAYARSYWPDHFFPDSLKEKIRENLSMYWREVDKRTLYTQALLIISSFRFAENEHDDLVKKSVSQLNSIYQRGIEDEANGLRWKELADNDDLSNSSEETIALLAEAFGESKDNSQISSDIIKWLLTAKTEHHWNTTKGTAAAINLLLKEKKNNSTGQEVNYLQSDKTLTVTNDLLKGESFHVSVTNSIPAEIKLQKQNDGPASGQFYWYYFTVSPGLNKSDSNLQLQKHFYKWNDKQNSWESFMEGEKLKIGDRIKVIMTIQSSRPLQYVFIDDKRAAAFEPADNSSGYEYSKSVSYYKSVRDAGFQFFVDRIPFGKTEIDYEMKVAQQGEFYSGAAMLQCMYKPELTVYSNSLNVIIEN